MNLDTMKTSSPSNTSTYATSIDTLLQDYMERLATRLNILDTELRYAWRALDMLSQEYIKMWERLEKLEVLLYEQQAVIGQLLDICAVDEPKSSASVAANVSNEAASVTAAAPVSARPAGVTQEEVQEPSTILSSNVDAQPSADGDRKLPDEAFYRSLNNAHRDNLSQISGSTDLELDFPDWDLSEQESHSLEQDIKDIWDKGSSPGASSVDVYTAKDYQEYKGELSCVSDHDLDELDKLSGSLRQVGNDKGSSLSTSGILTNKDNDVIIDVDNWSFSIHSSDSGMLSSSGCKLGSDEATDRDLTSLGSYRSLSPKSPSPNFLGRKASSPIPIKKRHDIVKTVDASSYRLSSPTFRAMSPVPPKSPTGLKSISPAKSPTQKINLPVSPTLRVVSPTLRPASPSLRATSPIMRTVSPSLGQTNLLSMSTSSPKRSPVPSPTRRALSPIIKTPSPSRRIASPSYKSPSHRSSPTYPIDTEYKTCSSLPMEMVQLKTGSQRKLQSYYVSANEATRQVTHTNLQNRAAALAQEAMVYRSSMRVPSTTHIHQPTGHHHVASERIYPYGYAPSAQMLEARGYPVHFPTPQYATAPTYEVRQPPAHSNAPMYDMRPTPTHAYDARPTPSHAYDVRPTPSHAYDSRPAHAHANASMYDGRQTPTHANAPMYDVRTSAAHAPELYRHISSPKKSAYKTYYTAYDASTGSYMYSGSPKASHKMSYHSPSKVQHEWISNYGTVSPSMQGTGLRQIPKPHVRGELYVQARGSAPIPIAAHRRREANLNIVSGTHSAPPNLMMTSVQGGHIDAVHGPIDAMQGPLTGSLMSMESILLAASNTPSQQPYTTSETKQMWDVMSHQHGRHPMDQYQKPRDQYRPMLSEETQESLQSYMTRNIVVSDSSGYITIAGGTLKDSEQMPPLTEEHSKKKKGRRGSLVSAVSQWIPSLGDMRRIGSASSLHGNEHPLFGSLRRSKSARSATKLPQQEPASGPPSSGGSTTSLPSKSKRRGSLKVLASMTGLLSKVRRKGSSQSLPDTEDSAEEWPQVRTRRGSFQMRSQPTLSSEVDLLDEDVSDMFATMPTTQTKTDADALSETTSIKTATSSGGAVTGTSAALSGSREFAVSRALGKYRQRQSSSGPSDVEQGSAQEDDDVDNRSKKRNGQVKHEKSWDDMPDTTSLSDVGEWTSSIKSEESEDAFTAVSEEKISPVEIIKSADAQKKRDVPIPKPRRELPVPKERKVVAAQEEVDTRRSQVPFKHQQEIRGSSEDTLDIFDASDVNHLFPTIQVKGDIDRNEPRAMKAAEQVSPKSVLASGSQTTSSQEIMGDFLDDVLTSTKSMDRPELVDDNLTANYVSTESAIFSCSINDERRDTINILETDHQKIVDRPESTESAFHSGGEAFISPRQDSMELISPRSSSASSGETGGPDISGPEDLSSEDERTADLKTAKKERLQKIKEPVDLPLEISQEKSKHVQHLLVMQEEQKQQLSHKLDVEYSASPPASALGPSGEGATALSPSEEPPTASLQGAGLLRAIKSQDGSQDGGSSRWKLIKALKDKSMEDKKYASETVSISKFYLNYVPSFISRQFSH
uniref:Uncharacterized protein n=1 Tax=Strigamia maritima TaxID=126957 RepID=T1II88_STRMM